jgi:hypothetical protein
LRDSRRSEPSNPTKSSNVLGQRLTKSKGVEFFSRVFVPPNKKWTPDPGSRKERKKAIIHETIPK